MDALVYLYLKMFWKCLEMETSHEILRSLKDSTHPQYDLQYILFCFCFFFFLKNELFPAVSWCVKN